MAIENTSIAKDNTIRVSQLKLANITRLIVNQKVNKAVEQLKFSNKRISQNVLKVTPFDKMGRPREIINKAFGDKSEYDKAISDLEYALYCSDIQKSA